MDLNDGVFELSHNLPLANYSINTYVLVEFFLSTLLSTSLLFKLILKTMPQIMLILSAKPFTLAPYYYKIDNILDIYYDYLIDTAQY